MKKICLLIIILTSPTYAQDECEYKLYVDSLHGFSMTVPSNQKIEIFSKYVEYIVWETGVVNFKFFVNSKEEFIDNFPRSYKNKANFESDDSLLALAKIKCKFSVGGRGDRAEAYGRIDSLIQWSNENDIHIIEFQRTQVFEVFDGTIENKKVGPLFFIRLNNFKGEIILEIDFYNYKSELDYNIAKKIVSSIKVIE